MRTSARSLVLVLTLVSSRNDHLWGEVGTDTCNGGTGTDHAASCEIQNSIP